MFIYVSPCSAAIPSYPTQPPTTSPGPHTASKPRRFFVVVVSYLKERQVRTKRVRKAKSSGGRSCWRSLDVSVVESHLKKQNKHTQTALSWKFFEFFLPKPYRNSDSETLNPFTWTENINLFVF